MMMMMLIVVIIIIVRSHLGSSVKDACEGRLLTMVSCVLFRGHFIPYFSEDWEGQ